LNFVIEGRLVLVDLFKQGRPKIEFEQEKLIEYNGGYCVDNMTSMGVAIYLNQFVKAITAYS